MSIPVTKGAIPVNLDAITGGLSAAEIHFEAQRGARFVLYQYVVSALIVSFRRNAGIVFVKPGERPSTRSLPWTLLTLLLGWWGFPWGFIWTPQVIYRNLKGGTDVTQAVLARVNPSQSSPM